jgi:hypothetical protein
VPVHESPAALGSIVDVVVVTAARVIRARDSHARHRHQLDDLDEGVRHHTFSPVRGASEFLILSTGVRTQRERYAGSRFSRPPSYGCCRCSAATNHVHTLLQKSRRRIPPRHSGAVARRRNQSLSSAMDSGSIARNPALRLKEYPRKSVHSWSGACREQNPAAACTKSTGFRYTLTPLAIEFWSRGGIRAGENSLSWRASSRYQYPFRRGSADRMRSWTWRRTS